MKFSSANVSQSSGTIKNIRMRNSVQLPLNSKSEFLSVKLGIGRTVKGPQIISPVCWCGGWRTAQMACGCGQAAGAARAAGAHSLPSAREDGCRGAAGRRVSTCVACSTALFKAPGRFAWNECSLLFSRWFRLPARLLLGSGWQCGSHSESMFFVIGTYKLTKK